MLGFNAAEGSTYGNLTLSIVEAKRVQNTAQRPAVYLH
jgi:hypothetical protein